MAGDGREGGYIKLHRRLKSWPLWRAMTCAQRAVWIEILMSANWRDEDAWYGSSRYLVRRGQLSHSENTIAKAAKVSRKVVRDTIGRLLSEGAVGREKSPIAGQAPWLITVVNYDKFQGGDDDEGQAEGQERAKVGPSSGQGRALREEEEEGKKEKRAPEAKPPAPATDRKSDPLLRRLSDALMVVGREERGGLFAFGGAKGAEAIKRLLSWSRDVDEHVRRFRLALRSPDVEYGYRVDTIAAFATDRIWNHFAPTGSGPTRVRPLAAPGGVS